MKLRSFDKTCRQTSKCNYSGSAILTYVKELAPTERFQCLKRTVGAEVISDVHSFLGSHVSRHFSRAHRLTTGISDFVQLKKTRLVALPT